MFSRNAKPGMFGLGKAPKENFLAYSSQFIFLIIRFVSGNVVMVAIDLGGKSPIIGECIMELNESMCYLFVFYVSFVCSSV